MSIASRAADELARPSDPWSSTSCSRSPMANGMATRSQDIVERSNGRVRLQPGNLPALKFMLDENLIEESERRPIAAKDDERRRYYRLTSSAARWRWWISRLEARRPMRARLVAGVAGPRLTPMWIDVSRRRRGGIAARCGSTRASSATGSATTRRVVRRLAPSVGRYAPLGRRAGFWTRIRSTPSVTASASDSRGRRAPGSRQPPQRIAHAAHPRRRPLRVRRPQKATLDRGGHRRHAGAGDRRQLGTLHRRQRVLLRPLLLPAPSG